MHGAAGAANLLGRVLQSAVDEGGVALGLGRHCAGDILGCHGGVEDVRAPSWDILENGLGDAKVLSEDRLGRVGDPVVEVKGGTVMLVHGPCLDSACCYLPDLVKIRLVKDEQKLVLVLKALHRVRDTLGKIPNVTVVELLALVYTILVNRRDNNAAGIYNAPFGLSMC